MTYKFCLLTHYVHNGSTVSNHHYFSDLVTACSNLPTRQRLRSTSSRHYDVLCTTLKFGEGVFSFATPSAWYCLPDDLQGLSDTNTFKRHLKTHLFTLVFARRGATGHFWCKWCHRNGYCIILYHCV